MRGSIPLRVAFALFGACPVLIGCGKKAPPASGDTTPPPAAGPGAPPGPGAKPGPRPGSIPLASIPYDVNKPDLKIDLTKFQSTISPKEPSFAEWSAKSGKVAEVEGVMGYLSADLKTGHETFLLKPAVGTGGGLACALLAPPDWRSAGPGRSVKVVGVLDAQKQLGGGLYVRLKDAIIMAVSGDKNPEVTAEQIGKDFRPANPAEFDKKWKASDKYYYVTGTLKRVDKIPLKGGRGPANKFAVGAGAVDLYCHIQNERGVDADPPKPGDKVTLLLACQGYEPTYRAVSMAGVYVGKTP